MGRGRVSRSKKCKVERQKGGGGNISDMRDRRGHWKVGKGVEIQEMRRIYGKREADQGYF